MFGAAEGKHIIKVIPEDGSDPYLSVGENIFSPQDMASVEWQESIVLGGGTTAGVVVPILQSLAVQIMVPVVPLPHQELVL